MFYTITNLQGSQTGLLIKIKLTVFYTITNLQGSQTDADCDRLARSFTPLQTYKVLKHDIESRNEAKVLHHYKLTRFSNPFMLEMDI